MRDNPSFEEEIVLLQVSCERRSRERIGEGKKSLHPSHAFFNFAPRNVTRRRLHCV